MSSLIEAIVVVELGPLRDRKAAGARTPTAGANPTANGGIAPKFVLVLPHGDPSKIPRNVLSFCFPDLTHLVKAPYHYEHTADEYVFTLTTKDQPRVHGFCRRYRVGIPAVGGRLDLTPFSSAREEDTQAPTYQCICILSERPYHRFFSQCLQLLHAARVAGGPTAMRLARTLLAFNAAAPGSIIPLRALTNVPQVPGHMHFARERLRVPPDVGLPYSDVPLAPLLSRLDAPALLALYVAMLTERRIMFVSQSISTLTSCVHAAVALLSPFPWVNIFIPVLDSSLLPYCCAPNPYIIGTSPAQFGQLAEEYDGLGELVLVALDEGYVACLNGAPPLVDLDGSSATGSGMGSGPGAGPGTLTFAGPKLSADRASAKASGSLMDSPTVTTGNSISSGFGGWMDALAGGGAGGDQGDSLGFTTTFNMSVPPGVELSQASLNRREGAAFAAATQGAVLGGMAAVESALSPFHSYSRSHAYDDEVVTARAYRRAYVGRRMLARRLAKAKVKELFGREPGQAKAIGGMTLRRPSGGLAGMFAQDKDGSGTPVTPAADSSIDMELDGFYAEESGTVALAVDLQSMSTGFPGEGNSNGQAGFRKRAPARGAVPMQTTSNSSTLARSLGISKLTGKLTALVTGGPSSDCPGARLAHEVREVYNREKREGAFDEQAISSAFLAFVGVVFARLPDFVSSSPSGLKFGKEDFTRASAGARYPAVARLLEEVQHAQLLQALACDVYTLLASAREANGGMPGNGYSHNGKLDAVELLFGEATTALAASGAYSASSSGAATPGAGGGVSAAFTTLQRKLSHALAGLVESLTDCPRVGDGQGIAGTNHSTSTALAGLAYASTCASAVSYAPPPGVLPPGMGPAPMPIIVTALRGLLTAATSIGTLPEESPSTVARLACAASHDPHLLHVVLGVLWARMNDCSDKNWPHGVRALQLLAALLRSGSPRVLSLAVSFIPLLRFLQHPVRAAAVRAGYFAEDLGGKADACNYVQAANVLNRNRSRGLFGATTGPIPGVTLSTAPGANTLAGLPLKEGMLLVARAAARCYTLIASPRRWLQERAVAAGPAAVANGAPLAGPFPYPLINVAAVAAPASASYPPGWLPSTSQPAPPPPSPDVPMSPEAPPQFPPLQRQAKAADAPWDVLHRVTAPAIASSRSRALATLAARHDTVMSRVISRPDHVHEAIARMTAISAGASFGEGGAAKPDAVHLSFLPVGMRPAGMAAACALPRRSYGGLPVDGEVGQAQGRSSRNSATAGQGMFTLDMDEQPKVLAAPAPAPVAAPTRPSGLPSGQRPDGYVPSRLSGGATTAAGVAAAGAARRPSGGVAAPLGPSTAPVALQAGPVASAASARPQASAAMPIRRPSGAGPGANGQASVGGAAAQAVPRAPEVDLFASVGHGHSKSTEHVTDLTDLFGAGGATGATGAGQTARPVEVQQVHVPVPVAVVAPVLAVAIAAPVPAPAPATVQSFTVADPFALPVARPQAAVAAPVPAPAPAPAPASARVAAPAPVTVPNPFDLDMPTFGQAAGGAGTAGAGAKAGGSSFDFDSWASPAPAPAAAPATPAFPDPFAFSAPFGANGASAAGAGQQQARPADPFAF